LVNFFILSFYTPGPPWNDSSFLLLEVSRLNRNIKYRDKVHKIVTEIVQNRLNKKMAKKAITHLASQEIPDDDRVRYIEVVETELMALHEGNIARYKLRPSEFLVWHRTWR
jgi:hypothetical protein